MSRLAQVKVEEVLLEEQLDIQPEAPSKKELEAAHCDKSPTGAHHFQLYGTGDGPCIHCKQLHSAVHKTGHKKSREGGRRMSETIEGMLTTVDLAKMAGVDPRVLRRTLRKSFGGGNRKTYTWKRDDPQVQEIVKAVKAAKEPKPKVDKPAKAGKATKKGKGKAKGKAKAKPPVETPPAPAEETPEQGLEGELTPDEPPAED